MYRFIFLALCLCAAAAQGQAPAYSYVVDDDSIYSNVPLNEISPRAFRHFRHDYGNITFEHWRKSEKELTVSFQTSDSSKYVISYSLKGRLQATNVFYYGDYAPFPVKYMLERWCEGCSVWYVSMQLEGHNATYDVGFIERNHVKIVEIEHGEPRLMEEYSLTPPRVPGP
jgi:hypothetical protein